MLEKIKKPSDLKSLSYKEIDHLASEIRDFLIENTEKSGGHLASNLGVVELTIALHRVFDSPRDHIIFDVGHQSYVHKILTGRIDSFDNMRKPGGPSGFTSPKESEHDPFGAGHSSTSISAALGFAEADRLNGIDAFSVAVIGDGAYTGGMAHEALNNSVKDLPLIIVLNENGMSISVNKGGFARYLSRVRISKSYRVFKRGTTSAVTKIPLLGKPIKACLSFIKEGFKRMFFSSNYFEDLGLYYIGPIDGNDVKKLEAALSDAKTAGKCTIIHVKTKKGKGYLPAEEKPDSFHSVSLANKEWVGFNKIFVNKLIEMSEIDEKIVGVTAAMGKGTNLESFGAKYPSRYFDVGIAEQHALTFAAGLAAAGMKPYVTIYSTFLQRAYDNAIHDIALQNLPVKLIIDRASLATSDGPTHHGIFDVAFLSHIPNFEIYTPLFSESFDFILKEINESTNPVAVRYPNSRENEIIKPLFIRDSENPYLLKYLNSNGADFVYISYGKITERVVSAIEILKNAGVSASLLAIEKIKPYADFAKAVLPYISKAKKVVFVEEGIKNGGAGQILFETLYGMGFDFSSVKFEIVAIDDNFAVPPSPMDIYDFLGISGEKLAKKMLS